MLAFSCPLEPDGYGVRSVASTLGRAGNGVNPRLAPNPNKGACETAVFPESESTGPLVFGLMSRSRFRLSSSLLEPHNHDWSCSDSDGPGQGFVGGLRSRTLRPR